MTVPASAVYDRIGRGYAGPRQAEPTWLAAVARGLAGCRTVVDVGAGTGSYEVPATVVAVEPSAVMVAQRPSGASPAVRARGEALPLRDGAADGALAVLTLHHWEDWRGGLAEMRRVSRRQVVLTFDPVVHDGYWLIEEYLPEIAALPLNAPPSPEAVAGELDGRVEVLPVPAECADAVLWAGWRRPELHLDPRVRAAASSTASLAPDVVAAGMERLAADLASGAWHRRHADLLAREHIDGGFRLVVAG